MQMDGKPAWPVDSRSNRYGLHTRISSAEGTLFPGGLHLIMLLIKTCWCLLKPQACRILSSSCPDRPTNGRPCRSSSLPGASPIMTMGAWGLPSPKITWFLVSAKPHLSQFNISLFNVSIVIFKALNTQKPVLKS